MNWLTALKQASEIRGLIIHDDQFYRYFCLALSLIGSRIPDLSRLEVKALERSADIRMIVDAHYHFAAYSGA